MHEKEKQEHQEFNQWLETNKNQLTSNGIDLIDFETRRQAKAYALIDMGHHITAAQAEGIGEHAAKIYEIFHKGDGELPPPTAPASENALLEPEDDKRMAA
jgi:hypothetical protein